MKWPNKNKISITGKKYGQDENLDSKVKNLKLMENGLTKFEKNNSETGKGNVYQWIRYIDGWWARIKKKKGLGVKDGQVATIWCIATTAI